MRVAVAVVVALAVAALAWAERAAAWRAGAASARITPLVGGTDEYIAPVDEYDATSPGTVVPEWDDGQMPVGNGDFASWARDHVRASVVALEDGAGQVLVVMSVDVYMLFSNDLQVYYDDMRRAVGEAVFARLHFLVAATHNHHGPDTSGLTGLNRQWFRYMLDRMLQITLDALARLEPADVAVADGKWWFGLGDVRDPLLADPTLNVLQARAPGTGRVIATVVQWGMHPEITLGFSPTVPDSDCAALGKEPGCSARGRFLSADFPGHLIDYLGAQTGNATVVFLNGPIGVQVGPHGPVWEVSDAFPIEGDGSTAPPGAVLLPRNFRMTRLIGRELANAAVRALKDARALVLPAGTVVEVRSTPFFTYLGNVLFRYGLAPSADEPTVPTFIGYALRPLWVCDVTQPPTNATCRPDNYETIRDGDLPVRVGNFAQAILTLYRFGPVSLLAVPGEVSAEMANGVPADFDLPESVSKYYKTPERHAVGPAYTMPGVLKDMLECDYCWIAGLGSDEAGYIFPIADWRIGCSAGPRCTGEGYISGADCKAILESGGQSAACTFGLANTPPSHFEEVLSVGFNVAEDTVNALSVITGVPPRGRYTKEVWTPRR